MFYTGNLMRSNTAYDPTDSQVPYRRWKKGGRRRNSDSLLPKFGHHFNVISTYPEYKGPKVSSRKTQDWRKVQFNRAPEGTFPVFTARGTLPDTEMQNFQPEKFNYSPPLKEYNVMIGSEIPLMRCDTDRYRQASHSLIPTFEFPLMSAFIINTEKKAGGVHEKRPMYVLPAGHYRQMMESESYELQCWVLPQLQISPDERWWVHEINPGYFFHSGYVYFLPHGWLICKERVKLLQLMAAHNELKRTKENTLHHFTRQKYHDIFSGRVPLPNRVGETKREYEQFLNDHELNSVIKWHSTKLNMDPIILFSAFHSFAHPVLRAILKHEKVDRDMIKQEIEVYMYYIQIYRLGYYYGPAPPYSYLKGLPSVQINGGMSYPEQDYRNDDRTQYLQVPGYRHRPQHRFSNFLGECELRQPTQYHTLSGASRRRLSSTRSSSHFDAPISRNYDYSQSGEFGNNSGQQNPDGFGSSLNPEFCSSIQDFSTYTNPDRGTELGYTVDDYADEHEVDPNSRLAFEGDDSESLASTIVSPLEATQSTITPETVAYQDLQGFQ